jgi:hypothetical protein
MMFALHSAFVSNRWFLFEAKQERLGTVEAPNVAAAIERGAAEFKVPVKRLMAIRR